MIYYNRPKKLNIATLIFEKLILENIINFEKKNYYYIFIKIYLK
jgi:hypothetical protein